MERPSWATDDVDPEYPSAARVYDCLVVSPASHEGRPDLAGSHTQLYQRTATPMTMCSRREIEALLGGFGLVPPGVVFLPLWRPDPPAGVDDHPKRFTGYAVVGRRR